MKISSLPGPWISFGVHLDFRHAKIEIHFVWWIIVLGNTNEPIHCGYCQKEIAGSNQAFAAMELEACPHCGTTLLGDPLLDECLQLFDYCQRNRNNIQHEKLADYVDRVQALLDGQNDEGGN